MPAEKKTCFVIMPFSKTTDEHTEEYWTKHFASFLAPLIEENQELRARRSEPLRGDILNQIITDLIECPVVVADLTDRNANVFWELGVRQSFKQGTLTIAEAGTAIPFDISTKSTLFYCPHDHIKMANFRQAFKNAIQDCLINPGATDSRVLEILGGRGTLFEIFRRDDTIRRIDALLSELKRNLDQIDYELKEKAQATTKEKALPSVTLFHSSALELLVAERYIDVSSETYDLFEHLLYMLLMLNRFMSGSVIEDIALKVFSKTKTYIEKCITEIKNYREKINNRL